MNTRKIAVLFGIGLFVVGAAQGEAGVRQVDSRVTTVAPDPIILQAADGYPGDDYGYNLAAYEDTLVVQSWRSNDGLSEGALYIYERQGEDWHFVQQLFPVDTSMLLGQVDIFEDHIVVGAIARQQEVLLFQKTDGTWQYTQKLTRSEGDFGSSVSLFGDYLAVGAPGTVIGFKQTGSVIIFRFNGSSWVFSEKLIPSDTDTFRNIGGTVDLSNDVLVGSYSTSYGGSGGILWGRSGSQWFWRTTVGVAYSSISNVTVSSANEVAAMGRTLEGSAEIDYYSVHVWAPNGTTWDHVSTLQPQDIEQYEYFGRSLQFWGDRLLVGRPGDDFWVENGGSVYLYSRGDRSWQLESIIDPPIPTADQNFGFTVTGSGDFWAASNFEYDGVYDGIVFLYDYFNPCYALTLTTEGNGDDLLSFPENSDGCSVGGFHPDEPVDLVGNPDPGWTIAGWTGTDDDSAVTTTNSLVMPHEAREVVVTYGECFFLTFDHSGSGEDPVPSHLSSPGCTEGSYIEGDQIALTAAPAENWLVAGWGGTDDDAVTDATNVVTMPAQDHLATVTYAGCFSLSLSHSGSGTDPVATPSSSSTCSEGRYREGELIQLSVTPDTDWTIVGWSGTDADASVNPTNQVTMPAGDHAVSVIYEICHSLVLNHSGSGAPLLANPAASPGCAQGKHVMGETITITAAPDAGWGIQSWSGTNNDAEVGLIGTLTMPDLDHVVSVIYATCYPLTTAHSGEGTDPLAAPTGSPGCVAGNFVHGHLVNLTASPAPGWGVEGWQGTDNDASVDVTNAVTMPAGAHTASVFYGTCFSLSSGHSGSGSNPIADPVMSPGCEVGHFRAGEVIQLTAQPDPDWIVVGWSGTDDDSSTSLTNAVTMPGRDHWVAVDYTRCYSLGISHQGEGADPVAVPTSSPGCAAGAYFPGEMIAFTAQPAGNWTVIGWVGTDSDQSVEPTNTLIMPEVDYAVSVIYSQCHNLTLGHSGMGEDPLAEPAASPGCDPNKYAVGQEIQLTADPAEGWGIQGWAGTDNDALSGLTNSVTMPDEDHFVIVIYGQYIIFIDGFELGDTSAWSETGQ